VQVKHQRPRGGPEASRGLTCVFKHTCRGAGQSRGAASPPRKRVYVQVDPCTAWGAWPHAARAHTSVPAPAHPLPAACEGQLDELDAPAYALLVHALGRMGHMPPRAWLDELLESAGSLLHDFSPEVRAVGAGGWGVAAARLLARVCWVHLGRALRRVWASVGVWGCVLCARVRERVHEHAHRLSST